MYFCIVSCILPKINTMQKLTRAEEEVMQMFWDRGPSLVSALIDSMPEPRPPHSSVSSIVRILEKKGFLGYKAYGKTYEYYPSISKKEYSKFSLSRLVSNYFEGSVNSLVTFLIEENDITLSELEKIKRQVDQDSQNEKVN